MTTPYQWLVVSLAFDPLGLHEGAYTRAQLSSVLSAQPPSDSCGLAVMVPPLATPCCMTAGLRHKPRTFEVVGDRRTWLGSNRIHAPPRPRPLERPMRPCHHHPRSLWLRRASRSALPAGQCQSAQRSWLRHWRRVQIAE